jgi:nucleotide-binding universal stress UspA family protein
VMEALEPLLEKAKALDVPVRPIAFVSRKPAEDICNVADVKQADLVILGWHKPLLSRTVLGGTVHDVMEAAHADVGVFVDRGLLQVKKVLVPYQGTEDDKGALRLARRLTLQTGVEVTILHVVTPERAGAGLKDVMDSTFVEGGNEAAVRVKLVSHATPSAAAVQEASKGYDLVLVAAGDQWGLEQRLFGMVPEDIVRECPASPLILRTRARAVRAAATRVPGARDPYPTMTPETARTET